MWTEDRGTGNLEKDRVIVHGKEAEYFAWRKAGGIPEIKESKPVIELKNVDARLILAKHNLLVPVETFIDTLPEPLQSEVKIRWDYQDTISSDNELVNLVLSGLSKTPDEIYNLFKGS